MKNAISRREFLNNVALVAAAGIAPQFLTRTVEGAAQTVAGFKDDRILVVVQLGGGNDGLNTLVPHQDDAYYRARPKLGLKKDDLQNLTDDLAFNAKLVDLMRLYDDGKLAVVQGVGYPNPDRSHFRSMEIWHTASGSDQFRSHGWIGRYFDHNCAGTARPQVGVALDKERPQAFDGERGLGIAFENPRQFGWQPGRGGDTEENFGRINRPRSGKDATLDFLRNVTTNALASSHEVRQAAERAGRSVGGGPSLGRSLQTVAGLIRGGLQTRIYYVSISGFDTHANQRGQHDNLLRVVGKSLARFQAKLDEDNLGDRVLTMVFSEFGRRVHENKSGGTDHGTAAPMFFMGDPVKPGIYGRTPSLTDLDEGDLKFSTDFRSAYATVLDRWFHVDPQPVLGKRFETLEVLV